MKKQEKIRTSSTSNKTHSLDPLLFARDISSLERKNKKEQIQLFWHFKIQYFSTILTNQREKYV
jgi:hypothetical protein